MALPHTCHAHLRLRVPAAPPSLAPILARSTPFAPAMTVGRPPSPSMFPPLQAFLSSPPSPFPWQTSLPTRRSFPRLPAPLRIMTFRPTLSMPWTSLQATSCLSCAILSARKPTQPTTRSRTAGGGLFFLRSTARRWTTTVVPPTATASPRVRVALATSSAQAALSAFPVATVPPAAARPRGRAGRNEHGSNWSAR